MKAAGKDNVWRIGLDYGISERAWRLPEEGGYNFTPVVLHGGIENWPFSRFILEGFADYTSSDFADRGAKRYLFGPQLSLKVPLISSDDERSELSLVPTGRIGLGFGDYKTQGGLHPHGGNDLAAQGGGRLTYSYMSLRGLGVEVGVGAAWGGSFWQDYSEHVFLIGATLLIGPEKPVECDDCFEKLDQDRDILAKRMTPLYAMQSQLEAHQKVADAYVQFMPTVYAKLQQVHQKILTYCPQEPSLAEFTPKVITIPALPSEALDGSTCLSRREEVKRKLVEADAWESGYPVLEKQLARQETAALKALEDSLNWSPECNPIPNPPRYLLYANDNPDISLDWQRRTEADRLLYANPVLDAVNLYANLKDNLKKKVRIVAVANETTPNWSGYDKLLAVGRDLSAAFYLTLKGLPTECEPDGDVCLFPSQIGKIWKGDKLQSYYELGFETRDGKIAQQRKWVGGSYQSKLESPKEYKETKRVTLDPSRLCLEAYTASELFKAPIWVG